MLQNLINMLERGESIQGVDENEAAARSGGNAGNFDDAMGRRARAYYGQEQSWRQRSRNRNRNRNRRRGARYTQETQAHENYDYFFAGFHFTNPQPGEAKRWLRQARYDLDTARNGFVIAHEWTCLMCFQVILSDLGTASRC